VADVAGVGEGEPVPSRVRIFIGSSSEAVHVAEALQSVLQDVAEVTLWPETFNVGEYSIEDLREAARVHDFAAFVFTPDDEVTSRGIPTHAPRDNVVFELGLFSSRLGPRRTFVVKAEGESVKVPSDIAGITYATYRAPEASHSDPRWEAAVRPAARKIRRAIDRAQEVELAAARPDSRYASSPQSQHPSPAELLASDLVGAARHRTLPPVDKVERGILVVHALLGVGQVVGYDPPAVADRMVRVRFASGVGLVDQAELSQALLRPDTPATE
jgi:hypothetical protein